MNPELYLDKFGFLDYPKRLLSRDADGNLRLDVFELDEHTRNSFPQYAIIAHQWEPDELTYQDVVQGKGREKPGYAKVQALLDRAKSSGLLYCWIASCCVDDQNVDEIVTVALSLQQWVNMAYKYYLCLSSRPSEVLIEPRKTKSQWLQWKYLKIDKSKIEVYSSDGVVVGAENLGKQDKYDFSLARPEYIPGLSRGPHTILRLGIDPTGGFDITVLETSHDDWRVEDRSTVSTAVDLTQDGQTPQVARRTGSHRPRPISPPLSFSSLTADDELDTPAQVGNDSETAVDISIPQAQAHAPSFQSSWSTTAARALLQQPCHMYRSMLWSVVLMSFLTSVLYSALKGDAGGGFTIGAFLLAAGAMLVSEMRARHLKRCRCDDTRAE